MGVSLRELIADVYYLFRLHFCRNVFSELEGKETSLTAIETLCVEAIHALGKPSIGEFAKFINISQANATYRIQGLIRKGYLTKQQSTTDKREYQLILTDRYKEYDDVAHSYINLVSERIEKRFNEQEVALFKHMLGIIAAELMAEAPDFKQKD